MKYNNYLSNEEIDELITKEMDTEYRAIPTDKEKLKAICNHRTKDGKNDILMMVDEKDKLIQCGICGRKFHIVDDLSSEEVEKKIQDVIDIIETIKASGVDFPDKMAREFYQIEAYIDRIPNMYEWAKKDWKKYELLNPNQAYLFKNIFDKENNYDAKD